jgi:creatinine amidohydrolase
MTDNKQQINEWELVSTNLNRVSGHKYEVAVLPIGAIEPHNRHLPYGQDFFHASYIARRCCELAWEKCHGVIALPAIPYGVDCNLLCFPLTMHVSQKTLDAMVGDIITSLQRHDIRKIVLINGHGGNDFKPFVRQIQSETDCYVFLCNWWLVAKDRYGDIFSKPDDHAGQMETSIAMSLYPELVELDAAGDGKAREFKFEALRKGWVVTSRDFGKLNDHCAVGDPSGATAERGCSYMEITCERISQFLIELANAPIDEYFPFKS